jgi:hypothetical protein
MIGIKVICGTLFGNNESAEVLNQHIGKTITALTMGKDDGLHFTFDDDSKMKLFDDGQTCCESRYMTTDDKLADFIGSQLLSAEVNEAPNIATAYGEPHEVAFLVVKTSIGVFTCETHNEHNGYYGGFLIQAEVE